MCVINTTTIILKSRVDILQSISLNVSPKQYLKYFSNFLTEGVKNHPI